MPIQKDEKEINSIDLKGTIKDKDIEIFALNDDIKLSINDKTNLYLKRFKTFCWHKNANDLKENINLYLDNCELNLDNKDYKIKDANVIIENGDINFEATIKDLDIPLKDGKTLEDTINRNYKADDLKIYTKTKI